MNTTAHTCSNCGGVDFEWGIMQTTTYRQGLGVLGGQKQSVKVRRCLTCCQLTLFTDEAITRRQAFLSAVWRVVRLIPLVVVMAAMIRGIILLLDYLNSFARETAKVKAQIYSLSDQIETTSNRLTGPFWKRRTDKDQVA
jgi:hypothetical protein